MSDIGISFPLPVLLALVGALYWPVTLAIAVVLAAIGLALRPRWLRVACFLIAAILAADCLLALWLPPD